MPGSSSTTRIVSICDVNSSSAGDSPGKAGRFRTARRSSARSRLSCARLCQSSSHLRPTARPVQGPPRRPAAEEREDEEEEQGEEEEAEREEEEPGPAVTVASRRSSVRRPSRRTRPTDHDRIVTAAPVSVGARADPDADADEGEGDEDACNHLHVHSFRVDCVMRDHGRTATWRTCERAARRGCGDTRGYSTVTVFARLRGWSTFRPRSRAIR